MKKIICALILSGTLVFISFIPTQLRFPKNRKPQRTALTVSTSSLLRKPDYSQYKTPDALGKMFPVISGETLAGTTKTIPADTKGKYTLIAMAYSSDAEQDLNTWLNPAYNKFIAKTGMFDSEYDVNIYFIPMFSGVNIATANTIKKRMKEEIEKGAQGYVMFYKGEISSYKKELELVQKDTPYIFLLDKEGKIIYSTNGIYSDEKMEAIEDKLK